MRPGSIDTAPPAAPVAAALVQPGLCLEQLDEAIGPAAEVDHVRWRAARLRPDGDEGGAAGGRREHAGVAPLEAGDVAELVAADQDLFRRDPVFGRELVHEPVDGVGLVGEADLDVFDVAGDARILEAVAGGEPLGQAEGLGEAAVVAGVNQAGLDGLVERADLGLGRVGPLGERDEVDLAAVQTVVDDADVEPGAGDEDGAHGVGRGGESPLLLRRCDATPERDFAAFLVEAPHL